MIRRKSHLAVGSITVLVGLYLFVAYFVLPEIWIFRDSEKIGSLSSMVTVTDDDIPGDPINVGLVGTKEEVIRGFAAAHWDPADRITLRSSVDIGLSVVLDRPDLDAPVSPLLFEGRKPALADNLFQIFVAPIFLAAEVFFALGYKPQLHQRVLQLSRAQRAESSSSLPRTSSRSGASGSRSA